MKTVISLFDYTGIMVKPWAEAGYECWTVDIRHPDPAAGDGISDGSGIVCVRHDLSRPWLFPGNRNDIAIVFAFPPCDHLAVSGARWFRGKGLRKLAESVNLFATAAEFCEWAGAPYMIENPVSTISSYWRKPDHVFHPWQYSALCSADNYTKKTCLWTGNGFRMPDTAADESLGPPDSRIHKMAPSDDRASKRSATPAGFAEAVFIENSRTIMEKTQ